MRESLPNEAEKLRKLSPAVLYSTFHEIQFETLNPKWIAQLNRLTANTSEEVVEISPARTPQVPSTFSEDAGNQIARANRQAIIFFNYSLSQTQDPLSLLTLVSKSGQRTIVIQDAPDDVPPFYDCQPELKELNDWNQRNQADAAPNLKGLFELAAGWSKSLDWEVSNDERLEFQYESELDKLAFCKMTLALDLIYEKFGNRKANFDVLLSELESWLLDPRSKAQVRGCSRWMVLHRTRLEP